MLFHRILLPFKSCAWHECSMVASPTVIWVSIVRAHTGVLGWERKRNAREIHASLWRSSYSKRFWILLSKYELLNYLEQNSHLCGTNSLSFPPCTFAHLIINFLCKNWMQCFCFVFWFLVFGFFLYGSLSNGLPDAVNVFNRKSIIYSKISALRCCCFFFF